TDQFTSRTSPPILLRLAAQRSSRSPSATTAAVRIRRRSMPILPGTIAALLLALLAGCTITRDTLPQRSATEQLMISAAADRAAAQLAVKLKPKSKVFLDASNFEGYDSKYAIGAITEQVLEHGGRLMPERKDADVVVAIRSGALSIDEANHL